MQSLEGGNANKPDQPGCRFLDGNGFCYIYGTAQVVFLSFFFLPGCRFLDGNGFCYVDGTAQVVDCI